MDDRKPWEQQPDESAEAHRAFSIFRDLGASRSVLKAYTKTRPTVGPGEAQVGPPKNIPGTWKKWAKRWQWQHRAQEWDKHLAQIHDRVQERVEQRTAYRLADHRARSIQARLRILEKIEEQIEQQLSRGRLGRQVVLERRVVNGKIVQRTLIQDGHRDLKGAHEIAREVFSTDEPNPPGDSDDLTNKLLNAGPDVLRRAQELYIALESNPGDDGDAPKPGAVAPSAAPEPVIHPAG